MPGPLMGVVCGEHMHMGVRLHVYMYMHAYKGLQKEGILRSSE